MRKLFLCALALAAGSGGALFAQNITGTWQGTLPGPAGRPPLRLVFKISRANDESVKATLYSIDQGGQPINASSATFQGSTLKLAIAAIAGNYEGKLSADGATITGNWSQGNTPQSLNLSRATPETAWEIPEPPPPPRQMPTDANPSFEVATIKPGNPATPGKSILVGPSGMFTTRNSSLAELISFAYSLHARQVSGGPAWAETEVYDISAKPDQPGIPNITQLRKMVQKLLTERFQLAFHKEKKELSVYAITIGKGGIKMTKTEGNRGNLPGFGGRGPGNIAVFNSKMDEFAEFLQSRILERPVVDQTGLTDRYDFTLQWTPDSAQLAALGPNAPPPPPPDADAKPDLFTAFLQQLGLKIESTKAPVDVLVIDKVTKPSEN